MPRNCDDHCSGAYKPRSKEIDCDLLVSLESCGELASLKTYGKDHVYLVLLTECSELLNIIGDIHIILMMRDLDI